MKEVEKVKVETSWKVERRGGERMRRQERPLMTVNFLCV